MKRVLLALCVLFLFLGFVCVNPQQQQQQSGATNKTTDAVVTNAPPVEPEWTGKVYSLTDGKLIPLEAQRPTADVKTKALGLGGGSFVYTYTESASPTRIQSSNTEFVIRFDGNADPAGLVILNRVATKNGKREIVTVKVGSMGLKTNKTVQNLKLTFAPYGKSVKITIADPLTAGEYGFRTISGVTYLFGVD